MNREDEEAISNDDLQGAPQTMGTETDYSDSAYDKLAEEAKKDDATGQHDFLVEERSQGYWPSGDPYIKIIGRLIDVPGNNKPRADLTWSPPPSPEEVMRDMATWDKGKKMAITKAVTIQKKCREHYSKNIEDIEEGDVLRVETYRERAKEPGRLGFLRVAALHSKDKIGQAGQSQALVPF